MNGPTESERAQNAAPGWYPNGSVMRYWDGEQWTANESPMLAPQSSGTSVGKIALGVILALVVVIVGVVFVVGFIGADDGIDCASENADRASQGLPLKDCG